jgi:hypothetical protein
MTGGAFGPFAGAAFATGGSSGPPYPASIGVPNGLGQFILGESPLGDVPPFNPWDTVISQYANSPIIDSLILSFDAALDQTENFDNFYDLIMNVYTAQGYGLDTWGRIVGVTRQILISIGAWFGFAEASPGSDTFGQGSFYSGEPLTDVYFLTDDAYRLLIFAKAAANITNGSIPAINRILMNLFPNRGNAYVTEGQDNIPYFGFAESINASGFDQAPFYTGESLGNMEMSYVFDFQLTPVELAIVQQSGVLPKPVGVAATVVVNP